MKQLNSPARPVRSLATAALVSASVFPLLVIALNLVQRRDYSPTRQAISELALGTGGDLMVLAFCGLGIGIFLLALIIFRTSRKARVTPLLLAVASVLAGPVSAAFHTDRTGAKTTMHGNIHNGAGLAAFLLILAAMITAAYRFRREPNWRSHAAPTTALAAVGIVTFFLIAMLGDNHFGPRPTTVRRHVRRLDPHHRRLRPQPQRGPAGHARSCSPRRADDPDYERVRSRRPRSIGTSRGNGSP